MNAKEINLETERDGGVKEENPPLQMAHIDSLESVVDFRDIVHFYNKCCHHCHQTCMNRELIDHPCVQMKSL